MRIPFEGGDVESRGSCGRVLRCLTTHYILEPCRRSWRSVVKANLLDFRKHHESRHRQPQRFSRKGR